MRPVHPKTQAQAEPLANPPGNPPTTSAPGAPAEPATELLLIVRRANGKMEPFGTLVIKEAHLPLYVEALEQVAESQPKDRVELGRPGTRLIVTKVDKSDPDFVGTSDDAFELGEVTTIPGFVNFLKQQFPRFSPTLVRYYLNRREPCVKCGYTVRALEDFLRDLRGPAARDFQEIADAHCAWAEANHYEPFQ